MGNAYCSRADVLAILSQDSEARLTTDPKRAVQLAAKGDGATKTFDTPFIGATLITVYVSGVETPAVLSRATGTAGVDQVVIDPAPADQSILTAKADQNAVDTSIIDAAIADAADEIDSYMPQNVSPLVLPDLIRRVRPKAVFLVKWRLRRRRDQQEWDPIMVEYAQVYKWLTALATGTIGLPDVPQVDPDTKGIAFGSEDTVFGPPYSAYNGRTF